MVTSKANKRAGDRKHLIPRVLVRIPSWVAYGRDVYRGIAAYLAEQGCEWELQTELIDGNEIRPVDLSEEWQGDGAIFFRYEEDEAKRLHNAGCAVVSISRESPLPWVPRVHMDNRSIGRVAAEHLLATGAPRYIYWGDPSRQYSDERLEGFRETIEAAYKPLVVIGCKASMFPLKDRWRKIYAEMKRQLAGVELPAALFARDDIAAFGLIDVARELGVDLPGALTIIGVGDDPVLCSVSNPSLSSVAVDGEVIGYRAAGLLAKRMKGMVRKTALRGAKSAAEVVELPAARITRRDSTNLLMVKDEVVIEGWALIRTLAITENLSVKDLCDRLGVSGTTLIKRFRRATGMAPKELIDRERYQAAVRFLNETCWPIKRVAYETGFRTPEEFDRFFKRQSGLTPSQYRGRRG